MISNHMLEYMQVIIDIQVFWSIYYFSKFCNAINPLSACDAFMRQWIGSGLSQVMDCSLFEAKLYWFVINRKYRNKLHRQLIQSNRLPLKNTYAYIVWKRLLICLRGKWVNSLKMRHKIYMVFEVICTTRCKNIYQDSPKPILWLWQQTHTRFSWGEAFYIIRTCTDNFIHP